MNRYSRDGMKYTHTYLCNKLDNDWGGGVEEHICKDIKVRIQTERADSMENKYKTKFGLFNFNIKSELLFENMKKYL